jgi:hypothetical protein
LPVEGSSIVQKACTQRAMVSNICDACSALSELHGGISMRSSWLPCRAIQREEGLLAMSTGLSPQIRTDSVTPVLRGILSSTGESVVEGATACEGVAESRNLSAILYLLSFPPPCGRKSRPVLRSVGCQTQGANIPALYQLRANCNFAISPQPRPKKS